MKYITLDFNGIKTLRELHEYFKTVFQLPKHYGRNMDALWDCLHCAYDEQTTINLKNVSSIPNEMREEVEIMLELFCDLEQKNMEVCVQVEDEKSVFNISDYMV